MLYLISFRIENRTGGATRHSRLHFLLRLTSFRYSSFAACTWVCWCVCGEVWLQEDVSLPKAAVARSVWPAWFASLLSSLLFAGAQSSWCLSSRAYPSSKSLILLSWFRSPPTFLLTPIPASTQSYTLFCQTTSAKHFAKSSIVEPSLTLPLSSKGLKEISSIPTTMETERNQTFGSRSSREIRAWQEPVLLLSGLSRQRRQPQPSPLQQLEQAESNNSLFKWRRRSYTQLTMPDTVLPMKRLKFFDKENQGTKQTKQKTQNKSQETKVI